ncbi:hypothetical protein PRK78_005658 [Emydomyces testavorans]|uniref:Uncharacterized protein n=1 Tax=Emydomyces testavorans TaxID=2070801 RepID=A0AAF0DL43_9EURO|nr:hypothetical protein PRK78_005658 [Emydomyces testavorans]
MTVNTRPIPTLEVISLASVDHKIPAFAFFSVWSGQQGAGPGFVALLLASVAYTAPLTPLEHTDSVNGIKRENGEDGDAQALTWIKREKGEDGDAQTLTWIKREKGEDVDTHPLNWI